VAHAQRVLINTDRAFYFFNTKQHGSTAFHWAASNCHLEVVRALLAAHADINATDQVNFVKKLGFSFSFCFNTHE